MKMSDLGTPLNWRDLPDIDDLEAKAEAASKGDWRSGSTWTRSIFSGVSYIGDTKRPEDASYIAAANPAGIKSIISRCRKAEAEVERLRGLLAEASESMRMSLSEFDYRKTQSASFSDPRWVDAARSISAKIEETLK